jgi:type IV pilus assembly protein PilM
MAQTVIGLDIGSWSIKAAVFESTLRGFSLVEVIEHRVPRTPEGLPAGTALRDLVRATLRTVHDYDALATSIEGGRVLSREIELPFSDERRIRSVLGFQLEGKLPGSLDNLVYDYSLIEADEDKARLFCPAVDRAWLVNMLEELKEGDADPRVVTLSALGYGRLLRHIGADLEETVALVDIGHEETTVAVVSNGVVQFTRSIGRGGHQITLALAESLDLDYGEAERVKHQSIQIDGRSDEDAQDASVQRHARVVNDALAPTLRDIRLTLHAHTQRGGQSIDRVYLFGGTCKLLGIEDVVARDLELPIQVPVISRQPWSQLAMDPQAQVSIPAAVGLGLRLVDEAGGESLNFRHGDLTFESDFKAIRDRAGFLLLVAFFLICGFFGRQVLELQALEAHHGQLTAALEEFSESVLGERRDSFDFVKKRLIKPLAKDEDPIFPEASAFRSFYDVTTVQNTVNNTPVAPEASEEGSEGSEDPDDAEKKSGYEVELKQIQADLKTLFIKGEANDIEAVEAFTSELKKNPCFNEVETNDTTRISFGDRQDWLRFQLKVEVVCQEPEPEKKVDSPDETSAQKNTEQDATANKGGDR